MVPFLFYNKLHQERRIDMTKTVADLIAYLQTMPQDAEVSIMDEARGVAARILRIRDHYANAPKVSEQSNCPLNHSQMVMRQLSL